MTPEKIVQNAILDYLKELKANGHPIYYERRQAGGFSYKKGVADVYFVYNGKHIEVEVKSPTGEQSTMQEKFEEECKRVNIPYWLINNIDEFKEKMFDFILESSS